MSLFQSKEKDGTLWVTANGYLTKDPKVLEKMTFFSVCYDQKKYMDCKVWANNEQLAALAGCLERHDVVSVSGKLEQYTGKDGKQRWTLTADYIGVVQIPVGNDVTHGSQSGGPLPGETSFAETEDDGELPF